jgi:hypothetical protein
MDNFKTRFPIGMSVHHRSNGNGEVVGYTDGYFGPQALVQFFTRNGEKSFIREITIDELRPGHLRHRSRSRSRSRSGNRNRHRGGAGTRRRNRSRSRRFLK